MRCEVRCVGIRENVGVKGSKRNKGQKGGKEKARGLRKDNR